MEYKRRCFPSLIAVNTADRMQLVLWYRSLPSGLIRKECEIKAAINARILKTQPITEQEAAAVGHPFSSRTIKVRANKKAKKK